MADAVSAAGGVQKQAVDSQHQQALPTLSAEEEQAARLALSKVVSGSDGGTALPPITAGFASAAGGSGGAAGQDSVMVGSGQATAVSGTQTPTLLSGHLGADSVVAGSGLLLQPPTTVPGGQSTAQGFHLSKDTIPQVGVTAATLKVDPTKTGAAGVTMPDQTKVNVAGVSAADLAKHHK